MSTPYDLSVVRTTNSPIYVTHDNTQLLRQLLTGFNSKRCMFIVDEQVAALHPWLSELLQAVFSDVVYAVVPSGETSKTVQEWTRLVDIALTNTLRRGTPVIAAGGGVTGDLAGFVASSVLRGLPLIHIPTTLLAMVDSSIGGKTGINHETGKNLIGAFYQPALVYADTRFLDTLPRKEWNCGLGEVLKYACIQDPSVFALLENTTLRENHQDMVYLVERCMKIKADMVMQDELENGVRAYLNFGHTFAHALEAHTRYRRFAHGEAVYVGLAAALWFASRLGAPVDPDRILGFRAAFNLQTRDLIPAIPSLVAAMYSDKKIRTGNLRLVLLNDWGEPVVQDVEDTRMVEQAWNFALENVHS